jgi:addiction module HigA family antidote
MKMHRQSTHPGVVLIEEFLRPVGLSVSGFARPIGVSVTDIEELIAGKRSMTPELAILFAKAFGTTEEFWTHLQTEYDRTAQNAVL